MPTTALLLLALASQPAPQPPVDGEGGKPSPPPPALDPVLDDQYRTNPFLIAIFGPMAQKLFFYYHAKTHYDFSQPYAPLRYEEVTHQKGLTCMRRIPKFGVEQYRCNILFHPAQEGGEIIHPVPYTFQLVPTFQDHRLASFKILMTKDGESLVHSLTPLTCPRYGGALADSMLPCAYTVDSDDVDDMYFPDDINPQGVAVGWGVVQEPPAPE